MKIKLLSGFSLFVLLVAFCISPKSVYSADWEMNFQSIYGANHQIHTGYLIPWAKSFEKITNGKLVIHDFPNSSLVDMMEAPKAIKSGMLDSGGWGASSDYQDFPYSMLFSLPFLVDNSVHGTELFWKIYEEIPGAKAEIDSVGQLLFQFSNTRSALFSINNPIKSPADLKGKRVIIITPADSEDVKAWGATPVFLPFTDVYVGLQRGMGDVLFCQLPMGISLKIDEIVKYITPIMSHATNMEWSMNKELFTDMPADLQQALLDNSGKEFSFKLAKALDADLLASIEKFKKAGCAIYNLTPEELSVFENSLDTQLDTYWIAKMKEYKVKDADAIVKQVYEMSDNLRQTGNK